MAETFHLTPEAWWTAADPVGPLTAPSLAAEGFIHCTTGADELVATANRHYRDDPRAFVVVTIDLDRVTSEIRTEDERRIYPHIFGPIDRAAIGTVRSAPRDATGRFLPLD